MGIEQEVLLPDNLPEFRNPPVVELVLGAQFDPIPSFRSVHLGILWRRFWSAFPVAVEVDPFPPEWEQFNDETSKRNPSVTQSLLNTMLHIGDRPALLRIRNSSQDRMIQIQNGRAHYNWLRRPESPYPRFASIRPEFVSMLDSLELYLREENLGEIKFNQWEVTYVNHLPQGDLWQSPGDWMDLFSTPPVLATSPGALALESLEASWHYEIPVHLGRLHVALRHSGGSIGSQGLILTLTARGPISPQVSLVDGLEIGHKTIVQSFRDLTSTRAHHHWGLIE